ncbi:signal peptidase I [Gryllotalpicola ginsengisoli]|uniref:signal peptidase I n=1 Tax=Gryllotalpicola ginsengisoli TaxID=444608 RepID=UPI0004278D0D|nr:signal peptidase I [Gryllotalpicola ginsengisoli]
MSAGILAIVVGIAVLVIIIPRATGAVPLTVLTQSMEPHFPPGTLLVVHKVPIDDIRIGDVVTYEPNPNDPTVISHRVIAITAESDGTKIFTVKGDNNAEADAPVQAKQIQAVLWYAVPWLGWVNSAVGSSEHSWVIPLAAGALLLYAGYLFVAHFVQRARASRRAAE